MIRALQPGDWPEVALIYAAGLATGLASFETEVPSWEDWDAGHLDVLRFELTRMGIDDLNPVQMMQLLNIDEEVSVQELVDRGHYVGSSAFYNIKKLVQTGYIEQSRSPSDRRAVRVRLTKKAHDLCARLREQQDALAASFAKLDEKGTDIEGAYKTLRSLERSWDDYLRYGKY